MTSKEMLNLKDEVCYHNLLNVKEYKENKFSIYRFKNKINGKVYIGQTIVPVRKRLIQHVTFSRPWTKCHKTYFHRALNKYGISNFDFSVIEFCNSQKELDEREKYWITYYKSTNKNYGYNIEIGGKNGAIGKKLTEEHKEKLLEANLGKHRKEETKEAIRKAHKLLWEDETFKKQHLEISIKNLSKKWEENRKKVYQYTLDGKYVATWDKCEDVTNFLYKKKDDNRKKIQGNLKRNIDSNNKKGKLGFSKKGYIWSFFAPQGKEEL